MAASRSANWAVILAALAVPVLGWSMMVVDEDLVSFRPFPQATLPHICASRAMLSIDCPLCGITRSVIHLMHGDWPASLKSHRMGWFVLSMIILQIPYQVLLVSGRPNSNKWRHKIDFIWWMLLIVLVSFNWLVEIVLSAQT